MRKRRLQELAGIREAYSRIEIPSDTPQEVGDFFKDLHSQIDRQFSIDGQDAVYQNVRGVFDLSLRIFDLFDARAGVEDDDHPDVNDRNASKVVKMAKAIISRNKALKGYKFEMGPEEKSWMTMSLRKH